MGKRGSFFSIETGILARGLDCCTIEKIILSPQFRINQLFEFLKTPEANPNPFLYFINLWREFCESVTGEKKEEGIIFCFFLSWGHGIQFIGLPMLIRFWEFKAG